MKTNIIRSIIITFLCAGSWQARCQWTTNGNDISNSNTGKVLITTNVTAPGTGTATEHFGLNSSTGIANSATAIGNGAVASKNNSIAIGDGATADYERTIAIGTQTPATEMNSINIGFDQYYVKSVGIGNNLRGGDINIGYSNYAKLGANDYYTSMLIGRELAATGQNELRIGSGVAGWWPTQIYLSGATSHYYAAHFGPQTFHAISGLGADRQGQGMIFKAGKSTGNAAGGEISFFTTAAGTSGTTENAEQERVRVDPAGNVGIGTTTPAAKLDVAGNIYSSGMVRIGDFTLPGSVLPGSDYALAVNGSALFTKAVVKLNINWPDYVFSKNYELPTLANVEKYINENSHLPGVASAQETEKNGIDLGDNQAVLLKKVEELTLYMIDMDKKMQQVQKENAEMKSENKSIRLELENLKAKQN